MIEEQTRYRRCCFVVDEGILKRFKAATNRDQVSMARAVEQFLLSYVYCLDSSFVGGAGKRPPKRGRKACYVRLSMNIYTEFAEKTQKEETDMNLIVEQFFNYYTAFMKTRQSSENRRAD